MHREDNEHTELSHDALQLFTSRIVQNAFWDMYVVRVVAVFMILVMLSAALQYRAGAQLSHII